jgi:hypothetical protein
VSFSCASLDRGRKEHSAHREAVEGDRDIACGSRVQLNGGSRGKDHKAQKGTSGELVVTLLSGFSARTFTFQVLLGEWSRYVGQSAGSVGRVRALDVPAHIVRLFTAQHDSRSAEVALRHASPWTDEKSSGR